MWEKKLHWQLDFLQPKITIIKYDQCDSLAKIQKKSAVFLLSGNKGNWKLSSFKLQLKKCILSLPSKLAIFFLSWNLIQSLLTTSLPLMRNWVCHLHCCHKKSHNIWLLWGVTTINVLWAPSYFSRFLLGAFFFCGQFVSLLLPDTQIVTHNHFFLPFLI